MANQLSFWIGQVLINDRFETSETFSISFELDRVSPIVNHDVDAVFPVQTRSSSSPFSSSSFHFPSSSFFSFPFPSSSSPLIVNPFYPTP